MRGLILLPSLQKRFISLAPHTPPNVATANEQAPKAKMMSESTVKNTSAWVEAPTVRPNNMVTMSMSGLAAVLARRFVTPLSFNRLPKNSIPKSGSADGLMKVVSNKPTIGKMTFSVLPTIRGSFIFIKRSSLVVSKRMIGGWMTGTKAMYEYAAIAIAPRRCGAIFVEMKIAVGPSAPPMIPIAAASCGSKPKARALMKVMNTPS